MVDIIGRRRVGRDLGLGGAALLGLVACMPEGGAGGGTPPMEDACGAAGLQQMVGQPASALDTMRFAQPMRVIRPGQAVTMDYNVERLNFAVGEDGRITRVYCG
ncbi:I78 family peptidase inhibitor [Frigidibacter oleivorans]|uniref:I78 family peptidase inhibitor n=1 Tax=Frigidibacter oleivorans TaxID=2487129 RepID=UPI001EED53FD|nr:I78 family peptidase inhibitor [Frigidibacter oleivorans]